jgi:hypothetical protein
MRYAVWQLSLLTNTVPDSAIHDRAERALLVRIRLIRQIIKAIVDVIRGEESQLARRINNELLHGGFPDRGRMCVGTFHAVALSLMRVIGHD